MKLFCLALLLSFSTFASELGNQLEKRHQNYLALRKHYSSLLGHTRVQNTNLFCTQVQKILPTLTLILQDDQNLISELRKYPNPEYREYAQLIDDNSRTPLFSYTAYTDLCEQNDRESILKLSQSLEYHVMNVDYLSMSNVLFWQSI